MDDGRPLAGNLVRAQTMLVVADLGRSVGFYADALGFDVSWRQDHIALATTQATRVLPRRRRLPRLGRRAGPERTADPLRCDRRAGQPATHPLTRGRAAGRQSRVGS